MELKFDEETVDTSLARRYIREDEELSQLLDQQTITPHYHDGKVYTSNKASRPLFLPLDTVNLSMEKKLQNLADRLKENAPLFGQLEYLQRAVPIEDTVSQINVIVQQIIYVANNMKREIEEFESMGLGVKRLERCLHMSSSSSILLLGIIPKVLIGLEYVLICAERSTAAVCHLFTKLCLEQGLQVGVMVTEHLDSELDINEMNYDYEALLPRGAIGVVSELSDVDSALEEFLLSSPEAPWALQRIFVQESVYPPFLASLKWKCDQRKRLEASSGDGAESVDELHYGKRVFLIDHLGTLEATARQVHVKAYRTRRELLTLLSDRRHRPHYMSLWANDVDEINEIAHAAAAPVTWVNSFGHFTGPPIVTEAVYSHACWISKEKPHIHANESELVARKHSWQQLEFETRRDKLYNTMETFVNRNPSKKTFWDSIKKNLDKTELPNFAHVGKPYVCYGLAGPTNDRVGYYLHWINRSFGRYQFDSILEDDIDLITKLLVSVLIGNGLVLPMSEDSNESADMFKNAGIPIAYSYDQLHIIMGRVLLAEAKRFMVDCLQAAGCLYRPATEQASLMLYADRMCLSKHGLDRLELYVYDMENGICQPNNEPEVTKEKASTVWINLNNVMGATAGHFAMDLAIKKASTDGIGLVAVKETSQDAEPLSYWAQKAASEKYMSTVLSNTAPIQSSYARKQQITSRRNVDEIISSVVKVEEPTFNDNRDSTGTQQYHEGKPPQRAQRTAMSPLKSWKIVDIFPEISTISDAEGSIENLAYCFVVVNPACFLFGFDDRLMERVHTWRELSTMDPYFTKQLLQTLQDGVMSEPQKGETIFYEAHQLYSSIALAQKLNVKPMNFGPPLQQRNFLDPYQSQSYQ